MYFLIKFDKIGVEIRKVEEKKRNEEGCRIFLTINSHGVEYVRGRKNRR